MVMRSWSVLIVLAVAFGGIVSRQLPGLAEALPPAAHAPAADTVAGVSFDGRGLPLAQLRDAIATRAGNRLDDATLASDRDAIHSALVARGYLDADVETPAVTRGARGAFVSFAVKLGALYHVGHVRVVATPAGHTRVITLVAGDEARATAIDAARAQVAAAATVHLYPDRATSLVDVDLIAP